MTPRGPALGRGPTPRRGAPRRRGAGHPVARPLRSVTDCIAEGVSPEITIDALREALARSLFSRAEYLAALRAEGIDRRTLPRELQ